MDKSTTLTLAIAITGLILLQTTTTTDYPNKTIKEIKSNCKGKFTTQGKIIKTFYSEKGNYLGIITGEEEQALIMLSETKTLPGNQVKVKGKASGYREQCFLFPEKVKIK